jgi:hypothetical protein
VDSNLQTRTLPALASGSRGRKLSLRGLFLKNRGTNGEEEALLVSAAV